MFCVVCSTCTAHVEVRHPGTLVERSGAESNSHPSDRPCPPCPARRPLPPSRGSSGGPGQPLPPPSQGRAASGGVSHVPLPPALGTVHSATGLPFPAASHSGCEREANGAEGQVPDFSPKPWLSTDLVCISYDNPVTQRKF